MSKKQAALLSGAVALVVAGVFLAQSERSPLEVIKASTQPVSRGTKQATRPLCPSLANPNIAVPADCIPEWMAKLPPDPGQEGMLSIEGIDADKDGVRDDVQRYIVERWGHSARAVQGLRLIAMNAQKQVTLGDSVSRDEAYEIAKKMGLSVDCLGRSVDMNILSGRALDYVETEVTNTPERFERWQKFEKLTANRVYLLTPSETPLSELCGYDPAKLPN